jgi:hypothetical protein
MSPTFALLLAFAPGQPTDAGWELAPRLTRGQELVYRGQFEEESNAVGARFRRVYNLETLVFVLDVSPRGADVAVQTVLRPSGSPPTAPGAARLELATMDPKGRVTLRSGAPAQVPVQGPPSLEPAGFVELPARRVGLGHTWEVPAGRRPPTAWTVEEADIQQGVRCLKLAGVQQSAEWDRPTGTAPAWRRTDTVWLAPRTGTVVRLERTVERRAGGEGTAGYKSVTTYELQGGGLTYPDQLGADRRREIQQAWQFHQALAQYLPQAGRVGPRPFEALLARIDHHLATQPATPYRPAVLAARQRAESGRRGETPPPDDIPD